MRNILVAFLVLVITASGIVFWLRQGQTGREFPFRTQVLERGPFLASVNASGPTQPMDVIDVGAQVAGIIKSFGLDPRTQAQLKLALAADCLGAWSSPAHPLLAGMVPIKHIDFGSPVEPGDILAQLDDALYRNDADMCQVELDLASADYLQLRAKLDQANNDWQRARELFLRKAIAVAEYELARVNHEIAQANVLSGKAKVDKAAKALERAQINLNYTTIRSPVKGIIIDRRVSVGQTVVASLNAPSLFLLARDLTKLQVYASVNEADIGHIKPGMKVLFTVDSIPSEVFPGMVAEDQPRLNATMTQNVVTYTVVVDTDNSRRKLLPYMTANVRFVLTQKEDALLAPNAALRFRPQPEQVAPSQRGEFIKMLHTRRPSQGANDKERTVWVREDLHLRPVQITVGLSDGTFSEVLAGPLREGDEVVTGEELPGDEPNANPFILKRTGTGGKK